jgi:prephenate dehydrogenase
MEIGIIGLGLIGGSIAQGLKKNHHKVNAYDKDVNSLNYAVDKNIIDKSFLDISEFLKNNKLVYLCLYPHDIINFFKTNIGFIQPGTIFIEVSGIKSSLISKIEEIEMSNIEIIYTHPIAGKESSGVYNSDCSIFNDSNYIIIDYFKNNKENVALVKKLAEEMGFNKISIVSKETHDDLLAYTSHITHLISMALVNSYDEETNVIDFAGDSYKDLTRIAQNNTVLWTDIFLNNSEYILKRLDLFIDELSLLKKEIQNNDFEKLQNLLERSNKLKKKYKKVR